MKTKNRKGSTLIMTLVVFVVLMIFGTFILSFMVNENKQSIHHQNKTQAYYIARSGAVAVEAAIEATIEDMSEVEKKALLNSIPISTTSFRVPLSFDNGTLKEVSIERNKNNNNITIKATGEANGVKEAVEKVIETDGIEGGEKLEIDMAVHTEGKVDIKSGKIIGNVTSNKGPIEKDEWNGKIIGAEKILNTPIPFPLPVFPEKNADIAFIENLPEFPSFPVYKPLVSKSTNLDFSWPVNEITINSDKQYESLEIPYGKTLVINSQESNINLWVNKMNLEGTDKLFGNIKILGNKQVNIYIKHSFIINSSLPITKADLLSPMNIYFSGNNISISGGTEGVIPANLYLNSSTSPTLTNARVKGDIYIYNGNISMTGGSNIGIDGNIYSKSGDINIPNGKINGNSFAMNGNITSAGSASIYGNLYSGNGEIKLSGAGISEGNVYAKSGNVEVSGYGRIVKGSVYSGKGNIEVTGSGKVNGNIYAQKGNMILSGSGSINGNMYSGDGDIRFSGSSSLNGNMISSGSQNIDLDGGGSIIKGLIYSPSTNVSFGSSAKVYGGIVSNTITMNNGGSLVEYRPENFDSSIIDIPNINGKLFLKKGHFK